MKDPYKLKGQILEQYDLFVNMQNNDPELKELRDKKRESSDAFLKFYQLLQKKDANWSVNELKQINDKMNHHNQMEKEYDQRLHKYLETHLSWLKTNYPDIYDLLVNREPIISRTTLEHVLDAYCKSESGVIDKKTALLQGLDYMQEKFNLPKDFFDKSKVDHFL